MRTPAEDCELRTIATIFYALGSATLSPYQVRKRYIVRTLDRKISTEKEPREEFFLCSLFNSFQANEEVNQTDNRTRESCPECVHLQISRPELRTCHREEDTMRKSAQRRFYPLPCSLPERRANRRHSRRYSRMPHQPSRQACRDSCQICRWLQIVRTASFR